MTSVAELIQKAQHFIDQLQDGEAHVIMALARKKNNPDIPSATDYRKVGIWREIVTKKDFEQKIRKVYTLAAHYDHEIAKPDDYNFYITHNPRSFHKALVAFKKFLAMYDYNPNTEMLKHFMAEWFSNLQGPEGRSRKLSFCLDIDVKDDELMTELCNQFTVQLVYETRNGYHMIINPQKLDVSRTPGRTMLNGFSDVEVGYDRLVYLGKVD